MAVLIHRAMFDGSGVEGLPVHRHRVVHKQLDSARIGFRELALSLGGLITDNRLLARTSLPLAAGHSALCRADGVLIGRSGAPRQRNYKNFRYYREVFV